MLRKLNYFKIIAILASIIILVQGISVFAIPDIPDTVLIEAEAEQLTFVSAPLFLPVGGNVPAEWLHVTPVLLVALMVWL